MIQVRGLRLMPGEDGDALRKRAAKKLGLRPGEIREYRLLRRSLDARRKDDVHYVCTLAVELGDKEARLLAHGKSADLSPYREKEYPIPRVKSAERPVVVGFGPAGMFASLLLAYAGARPIVLERGGDVDSRLAAVERFRAGGELDAENNVQFGEGGAGTFSDGKLNTGTHDERIAWVLRQFRAHGAQEEILWDAKPHIGTDVLGRVVKSIRRDIVEHGGEIRFFSRLTGLETENGSLTGARVHAPEGDYLLPCSKLILAIGHSARDTFAMLRDLGIMMERKAFSMGVRIEHRQSAIDRAQYGREHRNDLPAADYSLSVHFPDGESAYTFCMCPGGQVFAAASEAGGVVTNGMSYSGRGGENANAALLVTLRPEDFPSSDLFAGMEWQKEIERAAYSYGGGDYRAPAQLVGDFLSEKPSVGPGSVLPSYRPGVVWGDVREVLPDKITSVLARAIPEFGKKLRGFDDPDAVLTAPETRSSSPVRILRGRDLVSLSLAGLYPCGEGAGYAGGITSAAVDGLRCAEALLKELK